jgi:LuxR family transcriptional regulator, maltose regulon positive regulatory protein
MEWGNIDQHLLATKLTIPSLCYEKIIHRQRLYWLLDAALYYPIVLVSAPTGFGKTTLIAQWAREKEIAAAWVSLEKADNELTRFWCYIMAALNNQQPALYQQIECGLKPSSLLQIEVFLTDLINTLMHLNKNLFLVLDDYQIITDQAIQHSMIFLLTHLPPQLHLIIVTRSDPPLTIARLRVQGKLTEIRATDLLLTIDETHVFLDQVMDLPLTDQQITTLWQRTEGWIAGLQLATLSIAGHHSTDAIQHFIDTFAGSNRYILPYLFDEVLRPQSAEIQYFLLSTSILDRFSPALCNTIIGRNDSIELLEQLEQANLFLFLLDEQERWYRYHHLFADLLRYHLHQQYPEQETRLHQRASIWYEQQGMTNAAIHHALRSGLLERAADLLEHTSWSLLQQQEHSLISTWLSQLPESLFRQRPPLSYLRASLHKLLTTTEQEIPSLYSSTQEYHLPETLSEREYTVLRLIGRGLSNQEIAQNLFVTVSTIKTHLNNIYAKLHVHTRLQAVTKAYDLGLLSHGETRPLVYPDLPPELPYLHKPLSSL